MSENKNKRIVFAIPSAPLPALAAELLHAELVKSCPEGGFFDFTGTLVLTPTRQAARLLKDALAKVFFERHARGFCGLKVSTAQDVAQELCKDMPLANRFEEFFAWRGAIAALPPDMKEAIFGESPPEAAVDLRAFAKRFARLKKELAEGLADFAFAAMRLKSFDDAFRWEALMRLEALYRQRLGRAGKIDVSDALINLAKSGAPLGGAKKVFIVFTPDLAAAAIPLLSAAEAAGTLSVKIFTAAVKEDEALFDEWGRPLEAWAQKDSNIDIEDMEVFADLRAQASYVAQSAAVYKDSAALACAVSCDGGESLRIIASELGKLGVKSYDPGGERLADGEVFGYVAALKNWLEKPSYANFAALLRQAQLLKLLGEACALPSEKLLEAADDFYLSHLPQTARAALKISARKGGDAAKIYAAFDEVFTPLADARGVGLCAVLSAHFAKIFKRGQEDPALENGLAALEEALKDLSELHENDIAPADALDTIFCAYDARAEFAPAPFDAVALQNWLEVFWAPAPRVIAADFNEGLVPERRASDGFLCDAARTAIGISSALSRRARDSYMLNTLVKTRAAQGMGVVFCAPRQNASADALTPSGLLLNCDLPKLAAVTKKLFENPSEREAAPHFEAPWRLFIKKAPLPAHLSATDFKLYLKCPFRFYLERILKMRPKNFDVREMDAALTGTLFHKAFEEFAKSPAKDSADPSQIEAALLSALEACAFEMFGADVSAPLKIQLGGVRQRLRACALAQASHAAQGWRIRAAEEKFCGIRAGEFEVRMRFDRVDENAAGDLMIIDYKTFDSVRTSGAGSETQARHVKTDRSGQVVWKDLQLPLYKAALQKAKPDKQIFTAYFLAPKNVAETRIDAWDIDAGLLESALAKADEVAAKISAREFEPADIPAGEDNFAELFGFAPRALKQYLNFEL